MLNPEMFFADYMDTGLWIIGGLLIVAGIYFRGLRVLIFAGIIVPFIGLPAMNAQKSALSFFVTILEEDGDEIKWRTVADFRGGTFTFKNGKVVKITRPDAGGWKGTVVVNQSTKPLTIYVVPYTNFLNFPKITWEIGWKVPPVGKIDVPRRIGHIGPKSSPPPKTIKSITDLDTLLWLTWE